MGVGVDITFGEVMHHRVYITCACQIPKFEDVATKVILENVM